MIASLPLAIEATEPVLPGAANLEVSATFARTAIADHRRGHIGYGESSAPDAAVAVVDDAAR